MDRCPLCDKGPLNQFGHRLNQDVALIGCQRCGEYFVDGPAVAPLAQLPFEQRCYISAVTRRSWDSGGRVEIAFDDFQRLIDSAPKWSSPFEGVDRLLLLMASRTKRFVGPVQVEKEDDYPLLCARGPDEVNDLMHLAWQLGVLEPNKPVLTVAGWRRVDELRARQPNSRQAFVAMWFAAEMDAAWDGGFKPGIEDTKYFAAFRIDLAEYNDRIDDHIVAELRRSGLIVADFTGNRGGVYFEAGFGLGMGVPVIFTCRSDCIDVVHFDTRQYNHIVWETPEQLRSRLSDRIVATALPQGWLSNQEHG